MLQLDPHQKIIHDEMIKYPRYAAFMPTGSGKTITALETLKTLKIEQCLIIAPRLVIHNAWLAEIKRWGYPFVCHELRGRGLKKVDYSANLYLTTPESLISDKLPLILNNLYEQGPIALIVDESSKFKNRRSRRTQLLLKWAKNFSHCYLLSATPAPRSLENLWPQFALIDYGERLEKTLTKYRQKYFIQVPPVEFNIWKLREGQAKVIYNKIEDRAKSVKVQYLNPYRYQDHFIPRSSIVRQKLDELKENIIKNDLTKDSIIAANTATKLLQISGGTCYFEEDLIKFCTNKLNYLKEFIQNLQGQPVLIACNYKHEISRFFEYVEPALDFTAQAIFGGMKSKLVQEIIEEWNAGNIQVLLAQPAAMGHGLNLQYGGNQIVWFSPPLDLELYEQLNGRLNRKGQTESVFVHHLITEKTADQHYFNALRTKKSVQQALLDFIKA